MYFFINEEILAFYARFRSFFGNSYRFYKLQETLVLKIDNLKMLSYLDGKSQNNGDQNDGRESSPTGGKPIDDRENKNL